MKYNEIKKLIRNKLGTSIKTKDINSKSSGLSLNISIGVPFLNNVSDEILFNLITKNGKTFLTDDTWLNDDLESMGLFDNRKDIKSVQKYIKDAMNNGELPIKVVTYNTNEKELQMPINDIKELPFSIEMFAQEIIEVIASAQTVKYCL